MKNILLLFFLLSGCNGIFVRNEIGIGQTDTFSEFVQPDKEYLEGINAGTKLGKTFDLFKSLKLDLMLGPDILIPFNKDGKSIGATIAPRIRWKNFYLTPSIGMNYFTERWAPQATDWGFLLGGAIGARIEIAQNYWAFIEYKYWHTSNGSKVFNSERPNPGFNMGAIMIGIEWRF